MRELHTKELLVEIGKLLHHHRTNVLKWPLTGPQERGGPNYQTIERHEAGDIRTIQALDRHARILDLWLPDLLWMVLARHTGAKFQTEHQILAGHYDRTTEAGRHALMTVAAALPFRQAEQVEQIRQRPKKRDRHATTLRVRGTAHRSRTAS
jgi:hypothetical protein